MSLHASGSHKSTNQVRLVTSETCVVRYDAGRSCQRLQNRPTPCAVLVTFPPEPIYARLKYFICLYGPVCLLALS